MSVWILCQSRLVNRWFGRSDMWDTWSSLFVFGAAAGFFLCCVNENNYVVENSTQIHTWRLTWNIIMKVWKIIFLSKRVICRFQTLIFQVEPPTYQNCLCSSHGPEGRICQTHLFPTFGSNKTWSNDMLDFPLPIVTVSTRIISFFR